MWIRNGYDREDYFFVELFEEVSHYYFNFMLLFPPYLNEFICCLLSLCYTIIIITSIDFQLMVSVIIIIFTCTTTDVRVVDAFYIPKNQWNISW